MQASGRPGFAAMEKRAKDRLASLKEPHPHQFSRRELQSLEAVCDTLLPVVPGRLEASIALIDSLPDWVAGLMTQRLKPDKVRGLRIVLWLLSTRLGSLLLLGFWAFCAPFPFVHPFHALPLVRREAALLSWAQSRFLSIRALFKVLKSMCCSLYASLLDDSGYNPFQEAVGYSAPSQRSSDMSSPVSGPLDACCSGSETSEDAFLDTAEDTFAGDGAPAEPSSGGLGRFSSIESNEGAAPAIPRPVLRASVVDAAAAAGERLVEEMQIRGFGCCHVDSAGLQEVQERVGRLPEVASSKTGELQAVHIQCDAIIVGSGCGGAVVAARLASARPGSRILILEKGRYFAGEEFSQLEAPSMAELYEGGGFLSTEDGSLSVLAGTCVGGGSVVNWSASFRTPPHVRREWAQQHGLKQFDGPEYDVAMDEVCRRIGVNADNKVQNLSNAVLEEGCAQLGLPCEPIPRNAPPPHACGWCHFGCREGGKQCAATTWLADATRQGAVIMSSIRAERVLVAAAAQGGQGKRKAAGILGVVDYGGHPANATPLRHIVAEAPIVVVACGSLQTPALLLRSGLKNPNIGTHLRLHPVCSTFGSFPEEDQALNEKLPGRLPEGGIMTMVSGAVSNWNTSGYGALIQTPCVHPGLGAAGVPWFGKEDYLRRMLGYPRMATLITITRDSGRGRVFLDRMGQLAFDYSLNATDTRSLLNGIKASLSILRAAGAHEVGTCHQATKLIFDCKQTHTEKDFDQFLRRVDEAGVGKNEVPVFSAHQLGSCPMGVSPHVSAVDENAESWDVQGLFLGDASVLPTASGVNPMVTIESVAYLTGTRLAKRYLGGEFLSKEEGRSIVKPRM